MINGDFYGREMWIAFHSIAAKYVLLSKLLTLTLIVQSTLPSFQLQSVGYSWLGGFPSLQIPSAVRIRNSWVSGHPRGDQILRWRCARCQSARNFLHKAPQTRHGIVTMSTPSTPQGWWKCSSSSAISSRLMSSSITLPHVTYVTCISLSMMSMLRPLVIDLEDLSSFLLEVAFSFVLLFGTPRGQLIHLGVSAPGTTTHAAPCYAMLPWGGLVVWCPEPSCNTKSQRWEVDLTVVACCDMLWQ